MKRQDKTFFASVEGGEGVGKSTFFKLLSESLHQLSVKHVITREPGGTQVAEKLREIFNDPNRAEELTMEAEFLIISAARAQHVQRFIQPKLRAGSSLLCDRFVDTSRVYQGALGGLAESFIEDVSQVCTYGVKPDLTFLLDCDPKVSLARLDKRCAPKLGAEEKTRYDSKGLSFHLRVREEYLKLAERFPDRFIVLDASKSTENLVREALSHLKNGGFV